MSRVKMNYCPVCGSEDVEISDDAEPYARGKGPVVKICCNNCNHNSQLIVREIKEEHGHCPVCNKRTCLTLGRHYCSECNLIFEDPEISRVMRMDDDYYEIYVDTAHDLSNLDWKVLELIRDRPKLRFRQIADAVGDIDDADDIINCLREFGAITEGPPWSIANTGRILLKIHEQLECERNDLL